LAIIKNRLDRFLEHDLGELAMLTHMEKEAIEATRQPLYEALVKLGIANAFIECTAEQIDGLIETVWNALRASMHKQSARGTVPF
jgi:hypothetical protein